jgi:hypothetical protein
MMGGAGTYSTDNTLYAGWQWGSYWKGVFAGHWATYLLGQGSSGYWWSSTASSATSAYGLGFSTRSVYPAIYNYKHSGYTVRCVL